MSKQNFLFLIFQRRILRLQHPNIQTHNGIKSCLWRDNHLSSIVFSSISAPNMCILHIHSQGWQNQKVFSVYKYFPSNHKSYYMNFMKQIYISFVNNWKHKKNILKSNFEIKSVRQPSILIARLTNMPRTHINFARLRT